MDIHINIISKQNSKNNNIALKLTINDFFIKTTTIIKAQLKKQEKSKIRIQYKKKTSKVNFNAHENQIHKRQNTSQDQYDS